MQHFISRNAYLNVADKNQKATVRQIDGRQHLLYELK